LAAIVISTLAGVLLNFNQSVAKFALPDDEWNARPENILLGPPAGIRRLPDSPVPRIPAGSPAALPVGPLNAEDINLADLLLNYHNAAVYREKESNALCCTKQTKITQYIKQLSSAKR
jgi:hypothetical protein